MFIVCSGTVEIADGEGRQYQIGPGEIFGELALVSEHTRQHSATACAATEVAIITEPTFHRLVAAEPELALQIMQIMAARLRGHT